jgi:anti-anti-sigma regulatory factor
MSIRIDIQSEGPDVVLDVAGRLTRLEAAQLLSVCEQMEGQLVLDLSKLKFADDAGVEVIRSLREGGASIRGASSFIELLIKGGT